MKLIKTGNRLAVAMLAGACITVNLPAVYATMAVTTAHSLGGQAAPAAAGGSGFAVRVASNPDQSSANSIKDDLVKEGFPTAKVQAGNNGQYDVIIPEVSSESAANGLIEQLKKAGYPMSEKISTAGGASMAGLPSSTGEKVYRVEVAEFDTRDQATQASEVLRSESFVNFDLEKANGKHLLMVGTFKSETDATNLASEVKKAGFSLAKVVSRERMGGDASSAANADLSSLPSDQQGQTREILAMAEKVANGQATAAEMQELRNRIQQLNDAQRSILNQQEQNRAQEQSLATKVFPLYRDFDQAMKNSNYDQAEKILAQVKQIDPNNVYLQRRQEVLQRERTGGGTTGAPSGSRAIDPAAVQKAINEARTAEVSGNRAEALQKFQAVLTMDPNNVEAKGKVSQLSAPAAPTAVASQDSAASGSGKGLDPKLLYGGGGLLALILLALGWKKFGGRKDVPITTSAGASTTQYDFGTNPGDPLSGVSSPVASPGFSTDISAVSPADILSSDASSGMDGFSAIPMIQTDEEEEAPKPRKAPTPQPKEPESDSVSLDDLGVDFSAVGTETPAPAPTPAAPQEDEPVVSISLDDDVASPTPSPGGKSAMDADLEALLKGTFSAETDSGVSEPVIDLTPEVAPLVAEPESAAAEARLVYSESFDNESTGSTPAGWRGEYDYASLSVTETDEPGHAKCLVFSKTDGVGSATYHLNFPNASGRVVAEFDIRCDEKNKFLLGFYLEKDEDFKQSVHTIVHQLDASAPASLRLQGEPAHYDMGTWRNVRFDINLNTGTTDVFLDNDHVVKSAALASPPEYLNTLSIRDNLATTGTLYIDNIRITEA